MRKVHLIALGVSLAVAWASTPAAAIEVISTSADTTVQLDTGEQLEFENPLTGTETVGGYDILEWLDADYIALGNCDDWTCPADGSSTQVWLRNSTDSSSTISTVPSTIVSIHLPADYNDGLADVKVDGVLVAQLDMHTHDGEPGSTNGAFILVKYLSNGTHTIEVIDKGDTPRCGEHSHFEGCDDVHIWGAAVLEPRLEVECDGTESGGSGENSCGEPLRYTYPVTDPNSTLTDLYIGTDFLPPLGYTNRCMPNDWTFEVLELDDFEPPIDHDCDKTNHGQVSDNPLGLGFPLVIHFKAPSGTPGLPDGAFTFGFDHEASSHDVGWRALEGPDTTTMERWDMPVGWGVGPVHAPWVPGPCIPAVTVWGMVVMLLLVLAAGTIVIRRRRAAVA